jgi:hypothetical protein
VFSWGFNEYGQLGIGSHELVTAPVEIPAKQLQSRNIVDIACGYAFSVAVTRTRVSAADPPALWAHDLQWRDICWRSVAISEASSGVGTVVTRMCPYEIDHLQTHV